MSLSVWEMYVYVLWPGPRATARVSVRPMAHGVPRLGPAVPRASLLISVLSCRDRLTSGPC